MTLYILLGLFVGTCILAAKVHKTAAANPEAASPTGKFLLWLLKK